MPTTGRPRSLAALATATIALTFPLAFDVAPGRSASGTESATSAMPDTKSSFGHACAAAPSHGWPVKPFHRSHAVRGSFGDPRVDSPHPASA